RRAHRDPSDWSIPSNSAGGMEVGPLTVVKLTPTQMGADDPSLRLVGEQLGGGSSVVPESYAGGNDCTPAQKVRRPAHGRELAGGDSDAPGGVAERGLDFEQVPTFDAVVLLEVGYDPCAEVCQAGRSRSSLGWAPPEESVGCGVIRRIVHDLAAQTEPTSK